MTRQHCCCVNEPLNKALSPHHFLRVSERSSEFLMFFPQCIVTEWHWTHWMQFQSVTSVFRGCSAWGLYPNPFRIHTSALWWYLMYMCSYSYAVEKPEDSFCLWKDCKASCCFTPLLLLSENHHPAIEEIPVFTVSLKLYCTFVAPFQDLTYHQTVQRNNNTKTHDRGIVQWSIYIQ